MWWPIDTGNFDYEFANTVWGEGTPLPFSALYYCTLLCAGRSSSCSPLTQLSVLISCFRGDERTAWHGGQMRWLAGWPRMSCVHWVSIECRRGQQQENKCRQCNDRHPDSWGSWRRRWSVATFGGSRVAEGAAGYIRNMSGCGGEMGQGIGNNHIMWWRWWGYGGGVGVGRGESCFGNCSLHPTL